MQRLNRIGFEHCFICDVVLAELRYGAYNSNFVEDNLKMIDDFIEEVQVLPFANSIDVYAKEKVRLKKAGMPIEDFDLLIGCAAKAAKLFHAIYIAVQLTEHHYAVSIIDDFGFLRTGEVDGEGKAGR